MTKAYPYSRPDITRATAAMFVGVIKLLNSDGLVAEEADRPPH